VRVELVRYVASPTYVPDLGATRSVWTDDVFPTAGVFVFLTYLTVPRLLAVRSTTGAPARSFVDGEREREFLIRLLGITDAAGWSGGIGNARVHRLAASLGERHRRFPGMTPEYIDLLAAVIALAPLRVRAESGPLVGGDDRAAYWRYMTHAMAAIGAGLGSEPAESDRCRAWVKAHAAPSAAGLQLFASLARHHAAHVRRAMPILFERSQAVVEEFAGVHP
jgi:hypothetical protein